MTNIIIETVVTTEQTRLMKTIDPNHYILCANGKLELDDYLKEVEKATKQIYNERQNEQINIILK